MKLRSILSALVLTLGVAVAPTANAAIIMSLQEVGSDVLATVSGSADTTGFSLSGTTSIATGLSASLGVVSFGGSAWEFRGVLVGPSNFGPGPIQFATSGGGSAVAMRPTDLFLPVGYASGSAISDTMTFASNTLAGLGVSTGVYTWTWGSGDHADSLTLYIGVPVPGAAVPVPASLLLLATGVAAVGAARRRLSA